MKTDKEELQALQAVFRQKVHNSRVEYIRVTATLISTSFAIMAGMAWNQAVQAIFTQVLGTSTGIPSNLTYAIIITVVAVSATAIMARAASHAAGEDIELKVG